MFRTLRGLVAAGILFAIFSVPAIAAPVEWSFSNNNDFYYAIDPGSNDKLQFSGSFTYDVATNIYDWSNTLLTGTFNGESFSTGGFQQNPDPGNANAWGGFFTIPQGQGQIAGYTYDVRMLIEFDCGQQGGITDAEGDCRIYAYNNNLSSVAVVLHGPTGEEFDSQLYEGTTVITGSPLTQVPIPAAVWLFGSALSVLGWARRRKTV